MIRTGFDFLFIHFILMFFLSCSSGNSNEWLCQTDSDCYEGEICFNNHCLTKCNTNSDCSGGLVCINWVCQPELDAESQTDGGDAGNVDTAPGGDADNVDTSLDKVNAPQFSPLEGTSDQDIEVTLTCDTEAAIIYYTTNGTSPVIGSSSTYLNPIPITGDYTQVTIKAVAVKPGYKNSDERTAAYTIAYNTASTPYFSLPPGTYNGTQNLGILSSTNGAAIYYTTDSSIPFSDPQLFYSSPIPLNLFGSPWTIKAIAVKDGLRASNVIPGQYTILQYWEMATDQAQFHVRARHTSVVFDNKMWVIAGSYSDTYYNDVRHSNDGITWIQATGSADFSLRRGHSSVVFDNRMWVMGGCYREGLSVIDNITFNDVWYSYNGINWESATNGAAFDGRRGHSSVVFDNRMWVIGGYNSSIYCSTLSCWHNDVWYSDNGVIWTLATEHAYFDARHGHSSVVFDNRMWVIGGCSDYDTNFFNDVWYSYNGIIWVPATGNAKFARRDKHTSVVFNNRMWVIGGNNGSALKDSWYSTNGVTWKQATDNVAFVARYGHTSVVFDNRMWVIGGQHSDSTYFNDVWWSY